jgi:hypothetical protein
LSVSWPAITFKTPYCDSAEQMGAAQKTKEQARSKPAINFLFMTDFLLSRFEQP